MMQQFIALIIAYCLVYSALRFSQNQINFIKLTAVADQIRHKKGRRAKPRNWFYVRYLWWV